MPTFKFRPGTLAKGDDRFLIEVWDSTFPYLASVGSEQQWKDLPSTQPSSVERVRKMIVDCDHAAKVYPCGSSNWGPDWCRAYIAEVEVTDGDITDSLENKIETSGGEKSRIPVGAMVLTAKSSEYVRSVIPEQDEEEPFLYLVYLMTDHRVGTLAKGAGSALLTLAKEEVQKVGLKRLCGDCWRGNERKLVGYYEGQGLKAIGDFDAPRPDSSIWPGAVVEWRL